MISIKYKLLVFNFIAYFFLFGFSNIALCEIISTSLSTDANAYDNNQTIEFKLQLRNPSETAQDNVTVSTDWLQLEGDADGGGKQKIFSKIDIVAKATSRYPNQDSDPGTFNADQDLAITDARLSAHGTIIYTIKATVNTKVNSPIQLHAVINSADTNTLSLNRTDYQYTITKQAVSAEYQPNGKVVFIIRLSNTGSAVIYDAAIFDNFNAITAMDAYGNPSAHAFTSIDSITAKTEGAGSDPGDYISAGNNLNARNIMLIVGGWVEYTVTATVNKSLVGVIDNYATAHIRDVKEQSNIYQVKPSKGDLNLSYSVSPNASYKVGQQVEYTIEVKNKGAGYLHNYHVKNEIKALSNLLANKDLPGDFSQVDVPGNPFKTWRIEVIQIGTDSTSEVNKKGVINDDDLIDTISIAPGDKIVYRMTAETKPVSITSIDTIVTAISDDGVDSKDRSLSLTALPLNETDVDIVKQPISRDYIPDDWVQYKISVKNNDTEKFVNNFSLEDKIDTCLKVASIDGSQVPAFTAWRLSVNRETGDGTAPGDFPFKTDQTGDIHVVFDLAPNGAIEYLLEAKVNPQAIGTIIDNAPCPGDNVPEKGSGLDMPDGTPEVLKVVDHRKFTPGKPLKFSIYVKNAGRGYLNNLPIADKIGAVTAEVAGGGTEKAFSSWTVKAEAMDSSYQPSTRSNPDVDKQIGDDKDIDTHADIFPGDIIKYTVVAVTKNNITGPLTNQATAGSKAHSEVTATPKTYDLSIAKSVNKSWYTEGDNTFIYTIRINNASDAGFAKNIPVIDPIQDVKAELLHPKDKKEPAFKSWTITATAHGDNADAGLNGDWATKGLNALASIPPSGWIEYTITAELQDRLQDYIIWGNFTNTATMTTDEGNISDSANTAHRVPNIAVAKTVDVPYYTAGSTVIYTIIIENSGPGYANNTAVKDAITALGLFQRWTTTTKVAGLGTRVINPVEDDKDIDTYVDIAPYGKVIFEVKGVVIDDISKIDKVTNTVNLHDPDTNRDFSASADVTKDENKPSYSITKRTDSINFTPGSVLTYKVKATNHSDSTVSDLTIIDPMSDILANLANKKDGTHNDFLDQSPFEAWQYSIDEGKTWTTYDRNDILITNLSIEPKKPFELWINAKVLDNVVSDKITNRVAIYKQKSTKPIEGLAVAEIENRRAYSGGGIVRDWTPKHYKPGDTITYTINVSSKTGYFNNVNVQDNIKGMIVKTLSGKWMNPFSDAFTVKATLHDTHHGGTTDGTKDPTGIVKDNENLDVIIDVGGGDSVIYTIEGVVRDDAVGVIDNSGMRSLPFDPEYEYLKTTDQSNYIPGKAFTYHITIKNTGKVHLNDLVIKDDFKSIQVDDVDGNKVNAFTHWVINARNEPIANDPATGAKPAYESLYNPGVFSDDMPIDLKADIPIGGRITYDISAVVNPSAAGRITNIVEIGGDTTSVMTSPEPSYFTMSKTVLDLLDTDGNPMKTNAYMPGGYIRYSVKIENTHGGNVKDLKVIDNLTTITTDWFNGTKNPAFELWVVDVKTDGGGVSKGFVVDDNKDIDGLIDIGSGGYVEFVVLAKINEEAVGPIINTFQCKDSTHTFDKQSPTTVMAKSELTLKKKAFEDPSFTIPKTNYKPLDTVYYKMTLTNNGFGTLYNEQVKDIISTMKTDVAEDASTYGTKPKGQPFTNWKVYAEYNINGRVTNPGTFSPGERIDIDATEVAIAPKDSMDFIIEADIRYDALGNIINRIQVDDKQSVAKIIPLPKQGSVDKVILQIDGFPYVVGNTYTPGGEVTYRIIINNTSEGWANDVKIDDNISQVLTTLLDPVSGPMLNQPAFDSWIVTHRVTAGDNNKIDTYVPDIADTSDIHIELDIAPKETVMLTITAQIKNNAMGVIDSNSVTVDESKFNTDPIPSALGVLVFDKVVVKTDADKDPTHEYAPNGEVVYRVFVENTGNGFVNDVILKDPMNTLVSSGGQPVFDDITTTMESPVPTASFIDGDYQGNVALNATAVLAPKEKYSFLISGKVKSDVTGTITNVFSVNDEDKGVNLYPGEANLISEKTSDTSTYKPGQPITFTLKVTNQSDSIAETTISDNMTEIKVMTIDGVEKPVFQDVSKISMSCALEGDVVVSTFTTPVMSAAHNLLSHIVLAAKKPGQSPEYSSIICEMTGVVRDDAIGVFTNKAVVDKQDIDLGYDIKPGQPLLKIHKKTTKIPNNYQPGETIGFDIEITNQGEGYVTDAKFDDLLANLTTDVAGFPHVTEQVITDWINTKVSFSPNTGLSKMIAGSEVNNKTGYANQLIIHPDETAIIHLEGKVNDNALGDIENTGKVTYTANGVPSSVEGSNVYHPEKPLLHVEKTALKPTFSPADIVTFSIKITNNGLGWASDVKIVDDLSGIMAEFIGGGIGVAFEQNSMIVSHDGDHHFVRFISDYSNQFEAKADIAPATTLTFTVSAKLRAGIVGSVTNTAYVDTDAASSTIVEEKATVNYDKTANTDSHFNTGGLIYYYVNGLVDYTLHIKNNSAEVANDIIFKDSLSTIDTLTADGTLERAYLTWHITLETDTKNSVIDNNTGKDFVATTDQNLYVKIDLAPFSEAKFYVSAKVVPDAVGDITNNALLNYNGKDILSSMTVHPEPAVITEPAEKHSDQEYYEHNKRISFTLTIKNTARSFIYNEVVTDDLSAIEVDVMGGGKGPAFKAGTTQFELDTSIPLPDNSYVNPVRGDPNSFYITLSPGNELVFKGSGVVVDNAVGPIHNQAVFRGQTITSDDVLYIPPTLDAEFYTSNKFYVPGHKVVYHLNVTNKGSTFGYQVPLQTLFAESTGEYVEGITGRSFDQWLVTAETDDIGATNAGSFSDNHDIATNIDIEPGGFIHYTITPTVDIDMTSLIDVFAFYYHDHVTSILHATAAKNRTPTSRLAIPPQHELSALNLPPVPSTMVVKKDAVVHNKPNSTVNDSVTYTLTAYNEGQGNLTHVRLFDELTALKDSAGNPVFSGWSTEMKENGVPVDASQQPKPNENIDLFWNFKSQHRNTVELVINATINNINLDQDITNRFISTTEAGKTAEDSATSHIKKVVGNLKLSKHAKQTQIQPGQAVEYEILIENPQGLYFDNLSIEDYYPAGFRYVSGSATLNYTTLDDNTPIAGKTGVEVTDKLVFTPQKMESIQWNKLSVRYVLTASIGVTFGEYKNTAVAVTDNQMVSNKDSATVAIVGDKLFDTAAIIGKVFEDHNGNGFQSDATAKGVTFQAKIASQDYIQGSTTLTYNGQTLSLNDNKQPAINQSISINDLFGVSHQRHRGTREATLRFKTRSDQNFPFTVTSKTGTRIVFDSQGRYETLKTGHVAKGLSNENLIITRKIFAQNGAYLWEIHIENVGVYDEGIPGVNLITSEGIKVQTDEFGRFHIPDRWVLDKKGQNFTIKLDTDSLPTDMRVISENPKARRLTPNHLSKFNFSLQTKKEGIQSDDLPKVK